MKFFAAALALAWTATAFAGGREEFAAGEAEFRAGRCDEAARHFAAGYRLEPLPGFLFNEAQARRCLFDRGGDRGEARRALALFRFYLDSAPPLDPNRTTAAIALNELIHALPPGEAREPISLELPARVREAFTGSKPERVPPKPLSRKTRIAIGVGVGAALAVCLATALGLGLYGSDKNLPTVMPRW